MKLRARLVNGLVGLLIGSPLALAQDAQPTQTPPRQPEEVAPQGPTPHLVLSSTEWDFGARWRGESCSTEITISNAGDAPLRIIKVLKSCGCTPAEPKSGGSWNGKILQPGESEIMLLSYDTKKRTRKVSQTVTLETNDPRQRRVAIRVKGEIKPIYEVKPTERIVFTRIEPDATVTQSIDLRNNMEEKVFLKLKSVSNQRRPNDESPFEVKLEEIEPGMAYKLSATTTPPLKIGPNSANIVLGTGLEKVPSLIIPVSAYIMPRVAVRPPQLFVSPRVTKPVQRIVRVIYRSDTPVEIKDIKSSHPDLIKAELLPPREGPRPKTIMQTREIRVTLPPASELPEGGAQLEIYTDDPSPEYQKLTVHIKMYRAPARAVRPARHRTGSPSATVRPKPGTVKPTPEEKPEDEKPSRPAGKEKDDTGAPE